MLIPYSTDAPIYHSLRNIVVNFKLIADFSNSIHASQHFLNHLFLEIGINPSPKNDCAVRTLQEYTTMQNVWVFSDRGIDTVQKRCCLHAAMLLI